MKKLLKEYELALLFCGDGSTEKSINAIITVTEQFLERARAYEFCRCKFERLKNNCRLKVETCSICKV
jgi:hypothetical protein